MGRGFWGCFVAGGTGPTSVDFLKGEVVCTPSEKGGGR